MMCRYCNSKRNNFIPMDDEPEGFTDVEIAVNRPGELRIRVFDTNYDPITRRTVKIQYCPFCGKQFIKK